MWTSNKWFGFSREQFNSIDEAEFKLGGGDVNWGEHEINHERMGQLHRDMAARHRAMGGRFNEIAAREHDDAAKAQDEAAHHMYAFQQMGDRSKHMHPAASEAIKQAEESSKKAFNTSRAIEASD
jgi:hypothetical protein